MKTFINYAYIANLISENKNALQDEFRAERDSYREAENSRKLLNDTDMLEIKIKKLPLDGSIIPIHKYTTKGGGEELNPKEVPAWVNDEDDAIAWDQVEGVIGAFNAKSRIIKCWHCNIRTHRPKMHFQAKRRAAPSRIPF